MAESFKALDVLTGQTLPLEIVQAGISSLAFQHWKIYIHLRPTKYDFFSPLKLASPTVPAAP